MHVDLRGMTPAEAESAVAELIDQAQQLALQDFLLTCVEMGLTEAAVERELANQRAELAQIREQLLANFRSFVLRGGKQLH
jgi:DNA-nicking Smr family endonuclease